MKRATRWCQYGCCEPRGLQYCHHWLRYRSCSDRFNRIHAVPPRLAHYPDDQWSMDQAPWTMDHGPWTVDNGWPMVGQGLGNGWPMVGQWLTNGWPMVAAGCARGTARRLRPIISFFFGHQFSDWSIYMRIFSPTVRLVKREREGIGLGKTIWKFGLGKLIVEKFDGHNHGHGHGPWTIDQGPCSPWWSMDQA